MYESACCQGQSFALVFLLAARFGEAVAATAGLAIVFSAFPRAAPGRGTKTTGRNLYSYAGNNPLKNTDPTGMAYCQWDDGSHDDSANTGVSGAVNSGSECTGAGGTWSHDDGLNDDGSQMGSEGKPAFTTTATLNTATDQTTVSTSGPYYDPQQVWNYMLFQNLAQQTAWFPDICSVSGNVRAQIPGTPLKAALR